MGHSSLSQKAYEQILQWIETGEFPKGTVTSEIQISKILDMSRTPIRAALQRLELEGYIRIKSKHGVIILDSSSQRVSDLLEIIASMVLYSVSATWQSKREDMLSLAYGMSETFHVRINSGREDHKVLIDFEIELLRQFIMLCNNFEMIKTFQTTTSRLFWNQNNRRWKAPYAGETSEQVNKLIRSVAADIESFQEALLTYFHILKRTWL